MNGRTRKFFSYYKPYLRVFCADMICAVAAAGIALAIPLCARHITRDILGSGVPDAMSAILRTGLLMLILGVLYGACYMYIDYQGHMMGAWMERDMRRELFAHYQKLPFRFYDDHRVGQLMSRLTHDILSLSELFHHGPEDIVLNTVRIAGAFAILININVKLTLIVFLFLPLMAVYTVYFNRRLNAAMNKAKEKISNVNAQVEDSLSGIRVTQSFANEANELEKFNQANDAFLEGRRDTYRSEAWFYQGMQLFVDVINTAVIVIGGAMITGSTLDLADLLTYLLYIAGLTGPIQGLTHLTRNLQEGITGFHRFMDMLEVEPEIRDAPDAVRLECVSGAVEFADVSFRYTEAHDHVLRNITLRADAGETVAIVGHSGVGKTTLCSLIPRFYEVSGGAVLVDGVDIRGIALESLRGHIGVVEQDSFLFAGTVAENIRYGNPRAAMAELVDAAKRANAHEFILALPEGYDTQVGQRGVKLSGGQRQRLSIARAFLKDPAILILDEATSALDYESEQAVQQALATLTRDRTTFVIAHRLSTIRQADKIVVLTENGIGETGTHSELMEKGGAYATLYREHLVIAR